nr:hypothetical protein DSAG12_03496 [Candidatus Prometheoarchaeum syntrophicum]
MGKNNNQGLVLIAVLIAIISLGLSLTMYFGILPIQGSSSNEVGENSINRIMYASRDTDYTPALDYEKVPDCEINIIVEEGESVYISFSGQWAMTADGFGLAGAQIAIDNTAIDSSRRQEDGIVTSIFTHVIELSTQHVATGLSAGPHIISIEAIGLGTNAVIRDMNLFVYTYS